MVIDFVKEVKKLRDLHHAYLVDHSFVILPELLEQGVKVDNLIVSFEHVERIDALEMFRDMVDMRILAINNSLRKMKDLPFMVPEMVESMTVSAKIALDILEDLKNDCKT
ncbi:MAG: hypothetical protein D4R64_04835 [Porphyromonadaceae bacterium]|nr:MAG: hypothetical protein D4R64_04835 [Porphyromonadaceae bacterium]